MLTLTKFKVTNFRSVMDSGWIDCDDVTTLIGINEAGKSNLLLALWKLNPARNEGEASIDPQHDMPNSKFSIWRNETNKHCFIRAHFTLDDDSLSYFSENGIDIKDVVGIEVLRFFSGGHIVYCVTNSDEKRKVESDSHKIILDELPSFVYYSNYNNLDAQIYLPHAVDRLEGKAVLGYENPAKERTLRIMFEFVGLKPREILELGQAPVVAVQNQHYYLDTIKLKLYNIPMPISRGNINMKLKYEIKLSNLEREYAQNIVSDKSTSETFKKRAQIILACGVGGCFPSCKQMERNTERERQPIHPRQRERQAAPSERRQH